MLLVYPPGDGPNGYGDPIEYPSGTPYRFDPAVADPFNPGQDLVVTTPTGEVRYDLAVYWVQEVPD